MNYRQSDDPTGSPETARGGVSGGLNPPLCSPASPGVVLRPPGPVSGLPSREQLLHLVVRAERRTILPAEADLLRRTLTDLLDAPAVAVAQRDAALAELAEVREELVAARQQAAADRARLDRVLLDAGDVSPVLVACPSCGVPAGVRCRPKRGRRPGLYVEHAPRRRAVGRVLFAQALAEAGELR